MPGATQRYISPVLTQAAVRFDPPGLVWDQLMVPRPVKKESGIYYRWDKAEFQAPETRRANGARSNETSSGFTQDNYFCLKEALHEMLTDDDLDEADDATQAKMRSVRLVKQQVHNGIERRVFSSTGLINTNANVVAYSTLDLTNLTTASPRAFFDIAKNAIFTAAGVEPNMVFIGADIARNIKRTSEYREEFKYDASAMYRGTDLPTEFYGLAAHYVGGLTTGAFKKGQAQTLSRILGNKLFIAYVDPTEGDKILTWGKAFVEKEYAKEWREEGVEGNYVEYNIKLDLKVVATECGYRGDVTPTP